MSAFLKVALISTTVFSCEWLVSDNNGGAVLLDLTPLTNISMQTYDNLNDDYQYTFTPCFNGLLCPGSYGGKTMATKSNIYNYYNCESLGYWDDLQEPVMFYDNLDRTAFSFIYTGDYNSSVCNYRLQWNPIFICDDRYEYQISAVFVTQPCVYTVNINTKYACVDFPFSSTGYDPWTSSGPWDDCTYESYDGEHRLNLAQIGGEEIKMQDRNNSDYYYIYTPCTNTIRCAHDTFAMAYLFDINSLQCKKNLAQWDYGEDPPSYNEKDKIWEFVYTNGESCNGLQEVLVVDWICDPYSKTPKMIQAQQSGCVYTININSSIACY